MNIETALLNFITYKTLDYDQEPYIESKRLDSLTVDEERTVLRHVLHCFRIKAIEEVNADNNYYKPEDFKEIHNINFLSKDKVFCPKGSSWEEFSLEEKLSEYKLSRLGSDFYIKIAPPKEIQDQLDNYKIRLAAKQIQNEENKRQRKIKKAEKLLKEAGKI